MNRRQFALLQAAGYKASRGAERPLTSLADDVAATKRILALQDAPTPAPGWSSRRELRAAQSKKRSCATSAGDIAPERARVMYAEQGRIADTLFASSKTSVARLAFEAGVVLGVHARPRPSSSASSPSA